MNKILLQRKDRKLTRPGMKQLVISAEMHAKLVALAESTGRTLYDLSTELLERAYSVTEVVDR